MARLESNDDDVVTMMMAFLDLDVSDDDGSCAMSDELIAHAACASRDNGHHQTDLKLKGKERTEGIDG